MFDTDEREELECDVEDRETEGREDLELEDGALNADERGELESKYRMLDTYEREGLGSEDGVSEIEEREMLDLEYRDGSVDFNCGPEGVKNDEFAGTENKAENDFIEEQNHVSDGRSL